MSTSAIPVFDPQGTLRDVPQEQLAAAVKAGGTPAVKFIAPDKSMRYVPANRIQEAAAAGGQIQPYEDQDVKHPGFWSTLVDDVKGMAESVPSAIANALPNSMPHPIAAAVPAALANMDTEEKEGHGPLYRGTALAATALGANVPGMEESAREGDVGGVAGHATAVPAVMAATEGIARGAGPALDAAKPVVEAARPVAANVLRSAADVVSPDVTGIISPRLAHAQRLAGKIADALAVPEKEFKNPGAPLPEHPGTFPGAPLPEHPGTFPGAPLPETPAPEQVNPSLISPARTLPGMHSAEVIRPPAAPIPPRSGLQLAGEVEPSPGAAGSMVRSVEDAAVEPREEEGDESRPPSQNLDVPRTLSGESALRQILTGQDTANLLKIAKSRAINVTQESNLRPGIAGPKLINKIIDDFADHELDNVGATYLENTRMGKHDFGDIGPEAQKTLSLQTYFPDVKIPLAQELRTRNAIATAGAQKFATVTDLADALKANVKPNAKTPATVKASPVAETGTPAAPGGIADDLTSILKESLKRVKPKVEVSQ